MHGLGPRYQKRFRELFKEVGKPDFNKRFYEIFAEDLSAMYEEWQVFIVGLEYEYDIPRMAIDFAPGKELGDTLEKSRVIAVFPDRGWQNSGIRLEAGVRYRLKASGSWTKICRPAFWPGIKDLPERITIEANGVSIRYYRGMPLGFLQAVLHPDKPNSDKRSVFLNPIQAGLETLFTPEESGTLFLKINDSGADLRENDGRIQVEVAKP
jgi:hypothetical protein